MQKEISMLDIKKVVLDHQILRLKIALNQDVLDENKISYLRKDIIKLQEYIDNNDWKKRK
jgi:hypothetical protein